MDMRRNAFKAALKAGQVQLGIWSSLPFAPISEFLSQSGFDWMLLDAEHAPVDIAGLLPLLQAAAAGPAMAAVRPPWNDRVLLKRVLDMGALTVLVPFVQTPEEAAEAVKSVRYPPRGLRGVSGATRASAYGQVPGYLNKADEEICLIVQVETTEALARLPEIAAVDGVDGVFIGPSDLSASMGHLGNPGHPDVQKAIEQAAKTIRAAGKAPGILAMGAEDAKRYRDWGFLFVACSIDLRILTLGVNELLKTMKS